MECGCREPRRPIRRRPLTKMSDADFFWMVSARRSSSAWRPMKPGFTSEPHAKESRAELGIGREHRAFFRSSGADWAGKYRIMWLMPGVFHKRRANSGDNVPVTTVGYQRLIDHWKLSVLPLSQVTHIDTRVKGRETQPDGHRQYRRCLANQRTKFARAGQVVTHTKRGNRLSHWARSCAGAVTR